jgi:hypothetical protein
MQKKLLSFLLITAITYSCSKGLSQKDDKTNDSNEIKAESNKKK